MFKLSRRLKIFFVLILIFAAQLTSAGRNGRKGKPKGSPKVTDPRVATEISDGSTGAQAEEQGLTPEQIELLISKPVDLPPTPDRAVPKEETHDEQEGKEVGGSIDNQIEQTPEKATTTPKKADEKHDSNEETKGTENKSDQAAAITSEDPRTEGTQSTPEDLSQSAAGSQPRNNTNVDSDDSSKAHFILSSMAASICVTFLLFHF